MLHAAGADRRIRAQGNTTSKQSTREKLSEYLQGMSLRTQPPQAKLGCLIASAVPIIDAFMSKISCAALARQSL